MGNSTEGFNEFIKKLEDTKKLMGYAIDYALDDTGNKLAEDARNFSPKDTGTLKKSLEIRSDNKQTGGSGNPSVHSVTVWSSPAIIATNPKHPDGEYYSEKIENGFITPNGTFRKGDHMLKLAKSNFKRNIKASLKNELGGVFNR